VDLVDQLHDVRADRVAVAEAGIERQPVLAIDVHEVLAHLRVYRPLVEECDLVEPAPLAGERVMHDGAATLPGAQRTVGLPLELDRVGTAVALDGATVVGAEGFSERRPDVVVVVADQKPAQSRKALDQVSGQRIQDRWRIGYRSGTSNLRRNEARKQHEPRWLERVAELVVHAHGLVGRPLRRGVHALSVALAGREVLGLGYQSAKLPKTRPAPG